MSVFSDILALLGLGQIGQPTPVPQNVAYVGLDRSAYFGADALDYLRAATNLTWVAGYLDSPRPFSGEITPTGKTGVSGHNRNGTASASSWQTNLSDARSRSWGVLPIYWGEQDPGNGQGPWDLSTNAATNNANDAIEKAVSASLDAHTVIYIDFEIGGAPSAAARTYLSLWFETISEAGYRPGLYAHNAATVAMRTAWPDLFGWVTNPFLGIADVVSSTLLAGRVNFLGRSPAASGSGADKDNIAWQTCFVAAFHSDTNTTTDPWPTNLKFPPSAGGISVPITYADGAMGVNSARNGVGAVDANTASVGDPAFPERRMAAALIRRGRFSAVAQSSTVVAAFGVRRGLVQAYLWSPGGGSPTAVVLPDHQLTFNPWSSHATITRATSGDFVAVVRSALLVPSLIDTDDNWSIGAFRRRGTTWTFDSAVNGASAVEPLAGVQLASRAADTTEAFFVEAATHRLLVASSVDAATQVDGQPWSAPVEIAAPLVAGTAAVPSLVGALGAVSKSAGVMDVLLPMRSVAAVSAVTATTPMPAGTILPADPSPYNLFWSSSSALGVWPALAQVGDPSVRVHPFSNVAVVSRTAGQLDAFAFGQGPKDGTWQLYTWWWNPTAPWTTNGIQNTQPIVSSSPGILRPHPVSKVAVVSRAQLSMDVFVVGHDDGFLYTVRWDGTANNWSDYTRCGGGITTVGSVDAAIARDANSLDVFVTGRDGNVYVSSWTVASGTFTDLAHVAPLDV